MKLVMKIKLHNVYKLLCKVSFYVNYNYYASFSFLKKCQVLFLEAAARERGTVSPVPPVFFDQSFYNLTLKQALVHVLLALGFSRAKEGGRKLGERRL